MRYLSFTIVLSCIAFVLSFSAPSIAVSPGHENLPCTACHEDGSTPPSGKLGPLGHAVCQECHKDQQGPGHHGIGKVLDESMMRPIDLPLDEKRVVCASCHNPHGSPYEGLLRKSEPKLCNTCHNK